MIGHWDFFFFVPALLLFILMPLFLPSSSVYLCYFILAVPMHKSFSISCSHTEWDLIFFAKQHGQNAQRVSCQNLTIITIMDFQKDMIRLTDMYVADGKSVQSCRKILKSGAEYEKGWGMTRAERKKVNVLEMKW